MTEPNIWMPIVGILYVIPVFWLLDGFEVLVEQVGNRWKAVLWVLFWPVSMIVDMMENRND